MTGRYEPLANAAELPRLVRKLSARTMIIDVEPFIASWDSGQDALDRGIAHFLAGVPAIGSVTVVCFATNSARVPSALPAVADVRVEYLASARKPLHTGPFLRLPRPGVVVGDQVATDGLLARRLRYAFVYFRPPLRDMPVGPLMFRGGGELLRPLLFR